jgi:hypothetical protein
MRHGYPLSDLGLWLNAVGLHMARRVLERGEAPDEHDVGPTAAP